jgi:hypothetical protein
MNSRDSSVTVSNQLLALGDISLGSKKDMVINGNISAHEVDLTVSDGAISISGTINAIKGISLSAQNNITTGNTITSINGNVTLVAKKGSITVSNAVTAKNDILFDCDKDLLVSGSIGCQNLTLITEDGNLRLNGNITTTGDLEISSLWDTLIYGSIVSGDDVSIESRRGKVVVNNTITATSSRGNIILEAENGSITVVKAVTARNDIMFASDKDLLVSGNIGCHDLTLITEDGNLRLNET